MLYSHNNEFPNILPERIRLSTGMTRTDSNTFTEEEILDAGYKKVNDRPIFDTNIQKLEWSGEDWILIDLSEEEILSRTQAQWNNIRSHRDVKIESVIWRFQRYESEIRLGLTPTDDIQKLDVYVQALRDITKQEDPFNIVWPELDITINKK